MYKSDRDRKTAFQNVDRSGILEKVASLPITTWRFKDDDEEVHHMGPMAQDFYAAFGLGDDDKHINASEISGIALAAIQGLNEKLEEKDKEIQELKVHLAQISRQLDSMSTTSESAAD